MNIKLCDFIEHVLQECLRATHKRSRIIKIKNAIRKLKILKYLDMLEYNFCNDLPEGWVVTQVIVTASYLDDDTSMSVTAGSTSHAGATHAIFSEIYKGEKDDKNLGCRTRN